MCLRKLLGANVHVVVGALEHMWRNGMGVGIEHDGARKLKARLRADSVDGIHEHRAIRRESVRQLGGPCQQQRLIGQTDGRWQQGLGVLRSHQFHHPTKPALLRNRACRWALPQGLLVVV